MPAVGVSLVVPLTFVGRLIIGIKGWARAAESVTASRVRGAMADIAVAAVGTEEVEGVIRHGIAPPS